ncbi:MAG: ATP-binding protein [Paenibacillaceae bacterium]|nr:ATP-binding protein [Paenibacillaceae bacterium]
MLEGLTIMPYANMWDYYAEACTLLDRRLNELVREHAADAGEPAPPGAFAAPDPEAQEDGLAASFAGRVAASAEAGVYLPLPYVAGLFGLTAFETHVVLCAFAAELDRKYELAFGYLLDARQAKGPSMDTVLRLYYGTESAEAERWEARKAFAADGTLRRYFLRADKDRGQNALSAPLQLEERIVSFLLGTGGIDPRIEPFARFHDPAETLPGLLIGREAQTRLQEYTDAYFLQAGSAGEPKPYILFSVWGQTGAGKLLQVKHFARHFDQRLLIVDLRRMLADAVPFETAVKLALLEAVLQRVLPVFAHFEELLEEGEAVKKKRLHLLDAIRRTRSIVFVLSARQWKPAEPVLPVFVEIELPVPAALERVMLWEHFARGRSVGDTVDWGVMASKFRFTPGQIAHALDSAEQLAAWNRMERRLHMEELHQACYVQTQHKLDTKAKRLTPRHTWDRLILPAEQKDELRHACNQMKYRHVVYGKWGFDQRLSYGTGLSMLFTGPPGTGKTMAAEVIAKELYLEIYRIDLSQVISKYIGETEKNLQEIFREAAHSHAILFFDEADALFSKRSEVKDANDKYANMEVAYLLQKMEEYEGISIMATNLQQNIDEAFIRRISYVIKFPFPGADDRERLWRSMIPQDAPQRGLDYRLIAERIELAGGNIKNIAVSAAFMAAEEGGAIGMRHIAQAAKYELKKTGRIVIKELWDEAFD